MPRNRLTHEQRQYLEQRFQRNANWSTEYVKDLANRLNITFQKVYKWNWDRRQKEIGNQSFQNRDCRVPNALRSPSVDE